MGNLKGEPGQRSAAAGTKQAPKVTGLTRRFAETATAETPFFLPEPAEDTSVDVGENAAKESEEDAASAKEKPIFVPKGGPKREPERALSNRSPSSRPPPFESPSRHPRFRALVAIPITFAALFSISLLLSGPDRAELYRAELAIVEGLGFWGCLAAALAFEHGDYLRRAWLLEMSSFGLIFVGDLTLSTGVFSNRPWTLLVNGGLTLMANAGAMGGTLLLARAARVAGIEMPGSSATRRGVQAVALAVALLAAGPAVVMSARQGIGGDRIGFMHLASCLGDIFCFSLIAKLLLTTVAMRGGLLAWPWGFMTASWLAWLIFDAVQALSPLVFGISAESARPVLEVARCLACTCAFSAGLAQRWTIIDASG